MLGLEDIVGKRFESCEIDVVEELREEKGVLFAIFPIGATMQDGGKRKRSDDLLMYHKLYLTCISTTSRLILTNQVALKSPK